MNCLLTIVTLIVAAGLVLRVLVVRLAQPVRVTVEWRR
jgi:hypothetical protein